MVVVAPLLQIIIALVEIELDIGEAALGVVVWPFGSGPDHANILLELDVEDGSGRSIAGPGFGLAEKLGLGHIFFAILFLLIKLPAPPNDESLLFSR